MANLASKIKADIGVVKFLKSAWTDKNISDSLDLIAKEQKVTVQDVKDKIQKKIDEFQDIAKYSKMLYETIALNIIESEIFNMLTDLTHKAEEEQKFDPATFMALIRAVKAEHARFFPLRNFSDSKHLHNPRWILVPSDKEENKKYNSITTAAATPKGEFIFCVPFMQKLLDYARIKGLQPKSKKYSNNGGPFPPGYAYIEFLIIHELLHYTQSDFHYGKIYKEVSPQLLNWVGDFRSNYELVKGGYEQLPIGLYSDHINYDRQNTYKEMIDIVKAEMDKLPKKEQDKVKQQMDEMTDEHGEGEEEEGEGPDMEGKEGEVDKAGKATSKAMGEKKDSKGEGEGEGGDKPSDKKGSQPGKGNVTTTSKFDPSSIKPRYSWRDLISKAVKSSAETEETYMKPNRRGITGAVLARERGSAAVKPGDIETQVNVKLLVIVDSSGSMGSELSKVYANIKNLLSNREVGHTFLLTRFSDVFDEWACNVKTDKATNTEDKKVDKVSHVFTTTYGGGTQLQADMVEQARQRMSKGYNVLFFSDTDVLASSNFTQLKALLDMKAFVIFDSKATFEQAVGKLKSVPFGMSHL